MEEIVRQNVVLWLSRRGVVSCGDISCALLSGAEGRLSGGFTAGRISLSDLSDFDIMDFSKISLTEGIRAFLLPESLWKWLQSILFNF